MITEDTMFLPAHVVKNYCDAYDNPPSMQPDAFKPLIHMGDQTTPSPYTLTESEWKQWIDYQAKRRTMTALFDEVRENLREQENTPPTFEEAWRMGKRRQVRALHTPTAIRAEMAALYRESYQAGLEGSRFFTRMMYMLDCLMRATQSEAKKDVQDAKPSRKKKTPKAAQQELANDELNIR